jgi:siroheme synthase
MTKVYLIGAGPGNPGLITVKGLEILREADVVIYDYLVNKELLKEARAGAELICCEQIFRRISCSPGEDKRARCEKSGRRQKDSPA